MDTLGNKVVRKALGLTLKPYLGWYLRKDRSWSYEGLQINVPVGVFHPRFFLSSKTLYHHLKRMDLKGRHVLEVGCGSGFLSIACAKNGAIVSASDINPAAIRATLDNFRRNGQHTEVVHCCDVFPENVEEKFDLIICNPPYYKKDPLTMEERAWNAGVNLEFYRKFFQRSFPLLSGNGRQLLVISSLSPVEEIMALAGEAGIGLKIAHSESFPAEKMLILEGQKTWKPENL